MPLSSHAQGAAPDAWLLSLCLTTRPPVAPEDLWQAWSFAPVIVVPLALMLGLYGWAVAKYGPRERGITMTRGPALFVGGWLLLSIALVSPLCRMAATLASAHMVQHVILVALAPPLLVLGVWGLCNQMPGSPAARLPAKTRARPRGNHALRMLSGPAAASILYAVAIWASHVPLIYQAALKDATAHVVVTYGLVAVSVMFWRAVIDAALNPRTSSGTGGLALLAIFFAMVQTGLLGALLVLSPTLWYPLFAGSVAIWGLTPLEDQQLAGLIMWVPMGAIYLAAGLIVTMILVFGRRTDVSIALQPAVTLYRRSHQPRIPADRRRSCAAAKLN
jgi:cytochrome c oxidase assembly factor CtaG